MDLRLAIATMPTAVINENSNSTVKPIIAMARKRCWITHAKLRLFQVSNPTSSGRLKENNTLTTRLEPRLDSNAASASQPPQKSIAIEPAHRASARSRKNQISMRAWFVCVKFMCIPEIVDCMLMPQAFRQFDCKA